MMKFDPRLLGLVLALSLLPAYSNAVIEEKSSIVGTLLDVSQKPLAGVTIRLLDSFFLSEVTKTVTGNDGKFTLTNLLPGLYLVSLESPSIPAMLKRVAVISGSPTVLDIRSVLSGDELKQYNAWEKFRWTIRVAQRNPLRDQEGNVDDQSVSEYDSDGFFAALKNLQESMNMQGEVSYINLETGPQSSNLNHQMAQFALQGQLEGEGTWSINGNVFDGHRSSYSALGDFQYQLWGHKIGTTIAANDLIFARYPALLVEEERIARFISSPQLADAEENKQWITSVDLEDRWSLPKNLQLSYGTRIDYYGYLQERVSYSPRVGLSYEIMPELSMEGLFYRNQSAPGNFYLQPDEVHPYVHDLAFVPYTNDLQSETKTGYHAGIDYETPDMTLSAFYFSEDIANKIATIDLSDSTVNEQLRAIRPFVVLNAKDLRSQGLEIQITKQLTPVLTAVASYNVSNSIPIYIIEKRVFSDRQIFFKDGVAPEQNHDVQAGVIADIEPTQTQVRANWKWSSGSQVVFGRKGDNIALSTLDVEVHQGIPVHVFSETQLQLLIAIKNLLDQNPELSGNADFQRALLYGMPRIVAGGVLLKF